MILGVKMRTLIIAALTAVAVTGCGSSQHAAETWPGQFYGNADKVDLYEQTYATTDVKLLCSKAGDQLKILITAPDGTQVTSTRPNDGSMKADIQVTGGNHSPQTLANGALWSSPRGEWGFEGDPEDTDSHKVFYLHDGVAYCPVNH